MRPEHFFIVMLFALTLITACGENRGSEQVPGDVMRDTSLVVAVLDSENPVHICQVADSLLGADEITAAREMYVRALAMDSVGQVRAQDELHKVNDTPGRLKIKAGIRRCNALLEGLPFIGTKNLGEFWMAGAGFEFIQLYSLVIKPGGDVYLVESHYFPNEDRTEESERTLAGTYSPLMKGAGRFADDEYYQITATSFRLVDNEGKPLLLPGCCNQHDFAETGEEKDCDCGEIKF